MPASPVHSSTASRLMSQVKLTNRSRLFDAGIEGGMGVVFTLVTWGVVYWLTWVFWYFGGWSLTDIKPETMAPIVAATFAVVTVFSAWRRVDPLAKVPLMSTEQEFLMEFSLIAPGMMIVSPQHVIAGASWVLLGGPVGIFNAIDTLHHRLPAQPKLVEDAASILEQARHSVAASTIQNYQAAGLLRRMHLIKSDASADTKALHLIVTEKGRNLLEGGA